MSHVSPIGSKGGLLLVWRQGVDLECFLSTVNIINAWCYFDPLNKPWLLTCISGPLGKINKSSFWESFLNEVKDYYGHWLCIGNFNMILSQSAKYEGMHFACSSNDPIHSFIPLV